MTDLPTADNGSDSIMVIVDHGLSKGVVLIPTTKFGLTAERTAQLFLDHVYSRFGLPDSTLSDRGSQFESEFWQNLCKSLGIKSKLTTAFHPQTNGGTERVNREIQLYLASTIHPHGVKRSKRQNSFTTTDHMLTEVNPHIS